MSECEICGEEGAGYVVIIEGARMRTCSECAKGGKVVEAPRFSNEPNARGGVGAGGRAASFGGAGFGSGPGRSHRPKFEIEVVDDFGAKIKNARERMHLERKALAEMINEKEGVLERLEHEKMLPTESVAAKLQKALGVKLLEQVGTDEGGKAAKGEKKGLTLGDIVFVKKRKDDE
jgi:putative transcription factor